MISVNEGNTPKIEDNSILIQESYANQPIPNNRLPKGMYYSFKNKWVNILLLLTPDIKKIIASNTTTPTWGSITGTLSAQTDLQSALDRKMSSDLTDSHIFVGNTSNEATDVEMTGDVTIDNTGATTLANTAVTAGTYGDATNVPQLIVDSKGRLTGVTNVAISGASVTPSALTKTDDTNVTLTLGGTPSTALLQAVSLTLGWTGTLADGRIASASAWNGAVTDVALKANKTGVIQLVGAYTTNTTLTGTTAETSLGYVLIPANTYGAGKTAWVDSLLLRASGTSTIVARMRISTSATPTIASATLLATNNIPNTIQYAPFVRMNIHIDSSTSTKLWGASTSVIQDNANSANISDLNIDWTVDQYIHVSAQLITSGDSIILHKLRIFL
jgi:hypothetical protein